MLRIGTSKTINFLFVSNGKLKFLGVPILKHNRVVRYLGSKEYAKELKVAIAHNSTIGNWCRFLNVLGNNGRS